MKLKTLISVAACTAVLLTGCGKKQTPPTLFATDTVESYSLPMKSDFSDQYNTALALEFVSCLDKPVTFKKLFSYDNLRVPSFHNDSSWVDNAQQHISCCNFVLQAAIC